MLAFEPCDPCRCEMKINPGPDLAGHDILGHTDRISVDMMWLFTFSRLCSRAMLHAGDSTALLDTVVSAVENQTPYYSICFKSVGPRDPGSVKDDMCALKTDLDTELPKPVQERLGLKCRTAATAFYFPIQDTCEQAINCLILYAPVGYVPGALEVGVLEALSADIGKTLHRLQKDKGIQDQILELTCQKEMYHSVFENTGTGTIIIDPDMLILYVNAKFMDLVGLERNEIENRMRWSQFVVPGDNEMMQNYHYGRRKGREGIPTEYECRIFAKSGDIRYIDMKVGMIPGTGKSIASFMDITKRKLAENRLRQSEARLSDIIRTFEGLIYTTSEDYRVDFMNNALQEKAGRSGVGEKCYRVVHGLESPCPGCRLGLVLSGETRRWELKSPRDGQWYWSIQSPVYDNRGRIVKAQTIHMDITDRKRREEKICEDADLLRNENIVLRSAMKERYRFENIVGKSRAMQKVYELVVRAAASNAHVIIYGESGTGKELVARAIHNLSNRCEKHFVPVNCGAISEHIIESEFFGYRKGAFTGAEKDKEGFLGTADGGTLFLDEIGDLPVSMQVKLLRAIDGGGYYPIGSRSKHTSDFRIVAATNKNLKQLVDQGLMREDFYYRIQVIPIFLPPLKDRKEDIPLLVDHFTGIYAKNSPLKKIPNHIAAQILNHDWPGNIRELQNALLRFFSTGEFEILNMTAPPIQSHNLKRPVPLGDKNNNLSHAIETIEKEQIINALQSTNWHRSCAAAKLGISRSTLFRRMKKHGLELKQNVRY